MLCAVQFLNVLNVLIFTLLCVLCVQFIEFRKVIEFPPVSERAAKIGFSPVILLFVKICCPSFHLMFGICFGF